MPLQNRVDPFGELNATAARGTLFGNRGGKFHRDDRTLSRRRYATRQWICCVLSFKGRQRNVWGKYYTELFFLDEPTALAAGHRPCFECRRAEANNFALKFADGASRASAPEMDYILHAERLDGHEKRLYKRKLGELPDGVLVTDWTMTVFAVKGPHLLRWSPSGYVDTWSRPPEAEMDMLTPPSIAKILARGYMPRWHPSAETAE